MKILLGTDILLCCLLRADYIDGINVLFRWLNKLKIEKTADTSSVAILTNFAPISQFDRLDDVTLLKDIPKLTHRVASMKEKIQRMPSIEQKAAMTTLAHLNLLDNLCVDYLITENKLTHSLSYELGLDSKVYSIENFVEKCSIEHRELDDSKGAIVKICKFGELSTKDPFFYDFKKEYGVKYNSWFKRKANDDVFISLDTKGKLRALLKLKVEEETEDYSDITPTFNPARRLKICSLKVKYNGQKLGERFMRIVFEKALALNVEYVYVTIFNDSKSRKRLIDMISTWGFEKVGVKRSNKKYDEQVYSRRVRRDIRGNLKEEYPIHKLPEESYIVSLNKTYVQQLLPSDTLFQDCLDILPAKHAIKKILILKNNNYQIQKGSGILFFCKSNDMGNKKALAIGLAEKMYSQFDSMTDFINRCRKRSTLTDEELKIYWLNNKEKLTVVEFLYICGLEDENAEYNNMLMEENDGSEIQEIDNHLFYKILKGTKYEKYIDFNQA